MPQHFLLSAQARTISLAKVLRMSDEEAYSALKTVRFTENKGEPFCPKCGCVAVYEFKARKIFKCKGCQSQFSITSGTIFASRKLHIRDILAAIAIFVNGAKGYSALQLSRDLDVQYKTAFVLAHKLREVLGKEQDKVRHLKGEIEVDGGYFGGYVKPANYKANRRDRRLAVNQNGKRECVVVMRERNGRTLPFISSEHDAIPTIEAIAAPGSTIYADDAKAYDVLHDKFLTKRINHDQCYSDGEACTNNAESFFSRMRRAEIGTHHHIAGPYLSAYADEMAWREDHRRVSNGEQYVALVGAVSRTPISRQWKGYWQRKAA
ncbi:MAG: IS1595 family transposase [Proteobacteria bacterium]|nr:IS1595 family transposase [Pseudomonadota bacterium]